MFGKKICPFLIFALLVCAFPQTLSFADSTISYPLIGEENPVDLSTNAEDYRLETADGTYLYAVTGEEIKPDFRLIYTQASDQISYEVPAENYTLVFSNNIEEGQGQVLASFTVLDTEMNISANFYLVKSDIASAKFTLSKSQYSYSGKACQPTVKIMAGSYQLVSGSDYTLTYKNNTKPGKATAVVKGKGLFSGSKTLSFTISLASPTLKSSCSYLVNKLSWTKVSKATGYQVACATSKSGSYKIIKTLTTNKYSESVTFQKTRYYKVRAFVKISGKKYYSKWSTVKAQTNTLAKSNLFRADRLSRTFVALYWSPISGANGYSIYRSKSEGGTYTKIADSTDTANCRYYVKNIGPNTRYYYKIRAWRRVGGKKYYGAYSTAKANQTWSESKLHELFSYDVPRSASQMSPYLTHITVKVRTSSGATRYLTLTVHKKLSKKIAMIFKEMYQAKIPVRNADTAAYCWRTMTSCNLPSHHSYGCVVDLNWKSNPYVAGGGNAYRAGYRPGKDPYSITAKTVAIWKKYGFEWGGDWKTCKDYMHMTYTGH